MLGNEWFYGWFDLGFMTAIIGLDHLYIALYVHRHFDHHGALSGPADGSSPCVRGVWLAGLLGCGISADQTGCWVGMRLCHHFDIQ